MFSARARRLRGLFTVSIGVQPACHRAIGIAQKIGAVNAFRVKSMLAHSRGGTGNRNALDTRITAKRVSANMLHALSDYHILHVKVVPRRRVLLRVVAHRLRTHDVQGLGSRIICVIHAGRIRFSAASAHFAFAVRLYGTCRYIMADIRSR